MYGGGPPLGRRRGGLERVRRMVSEAADWGYGFAGGVCGAPEADGARRGGSTGPAAGGGAAGAGAAGGAASVFLRSDLCERDGEVQHGSEHSRSGDGTWAAAGAGTGHRHGGGAERSVPGFNGLGGDRVRFFRDGRGGGAALGGAGGGETNGAGGAAREVRLRAQAVGPGGDELHLGSDPRGGLCGADHRFATAGGRAGFRAPDG